MLTLLLVRHATTLANEEGLWIGRSESDISDRGRKELEALKSQIEKWQIDGAYVSPSLRTLETAKIVLKSDILVETVEALREIDFGSFEGKHFKWAQEAVPEEIEKMIIQGDAYCYPQGESMLSAHDRIRAWLRKWLSEKPEGCYLICTHGGTVRSILSELLVNSAQLHWHFKIDPASLSIVTIRDDFAVIEALNQKKNSV